MNNQARRAESPAHSLSSRLGTERHSARLTSCASHQEETGPAGDGHPPSHFGELRPQKIRGCSAGGDKAGPPPRMGFQTCPLAG